MKELKLRKQALRLESELNRLSLRAGSAQLRRSTADLAQMAQIFRQRRSSWLALATLAGLLLARRRSPSPESEASGRPSESPKKSKAWLRLLRDILDIVIRA